MIRTAKAPTTLNDPLENIIRSIDSIPPFPEVVLRVLEIAEDPDASAGDIVNVIQFDQAVTANCLRLCNSSYFGLREPVRSLQHAVVLLGTGNLVKIVIADCCRLSAFSKAHTGYGLEAGQLWRHSMASAVTSQVIAARIGFKDIHELFTAALLHDIGKLVIDRFIADNFEAMFQLMQDEGYGMVETEKAYFGIDHAEAGGLIAKAWGFPDSLTAAIENHHRLTPEQHPQGLAEVTALCNLMAHVNSDDPSRFRHPHIHMGIDKAILTGFGLSQPDVSEICHTASAEINKAEALFKLPV